MGIGHGYHLKRIHRKEGTGTQLSVEVRHCSQWIDIFQLARSLRDMGIVLTSMVMVSEVTWYVFLDRV